MRGVLRDAPARGSYARPRELKQPENGFILNRATEEWRRIPQFSIDSFRLRCEARGELVAACLMVFHEAIDGLQAAAKAYGLIRKIAIQHIIAEAFTRVQ
jgi:hypothetical protein